MAVIIMNRFVIAPMFAPSDQELVGDPIPTAFENTQSLTQVAKGLRSRLSSLATGPPEDQTGYGVGLCLQEGKQLACLAW